MNRIVLEFKEPAVGEEFLSWVDPVDVAVGLKPDSFYFTTRREGYNPITPYSEGRWVAVDRREP